MARALRGHLRVSPTGDEQPGDVAGQHGTQLTLDTRGVGPGFVVAAPWSMGGTSCLARGAFRPVVLPSRARDDSTQNAFCDGASQAGRAAWLRRKSQRTAG